jgi:hypothetical protein
MQFSIIPKGALLVPSLSSETYSSPEWLNARVIRYVTCALVPVMSISSVPPSSRHLKDTE